MSTEIATITIKYPALAMSSADMREAFEANQGPPGQEVRLESLLTKVACPKQGNTVWAIPGDDGNEETVPELRGIIVYRGFRGLIWPSKETPKGTLPTLRTDDLRTAYQVGEDWGTLPRKQIEALRQPDGSYPWTGDGGKGGLAGDGGPCGWPAVAKSDKTTKRTRLAKEMRVLGFLGEGQLAPWLIFVPPTSVAKIDTGIRKLSMSGVPYYGAEVRLYAKKEEAGGFTISRIYVTPVGTLPLDQRQYIKKCYTDTLAQAIQNVEIDAEDGEGFDEIA
jgi:hypothetical protein